MHTYFIQMMTKQLFTTQENHYSFFDQKTWIKRDSGLFDVMIGAYDWAEVYELVGNYLLYEP